MTGEQKTLACCLQHSPKSRPRFVSWFPDKSNACRNCSAGAYISSACHTPPKSREVTSWTWDVDTAHQVHKTVASNQCAAKVHGQQWAFVFQVPHHRLKRFCTPCTRHVSGNKSPHQASPTDRHVAGHGPTRDARERWWGWVVEL